MGSFRSIELSPVHSFYSACTPRSMFVIIIPIIAENVSICQTQLQLIAIGKEIHDIHDTYIT